MQHTTLPISNMRTEARIMCAAFVSENLLSAFEFKANSVIDMAQDLHKFHWQ
jgi:hypothetical protein